MNSWPKAFADHMQAAAVYQAFQAKGNEEPVWLLPPLLAKQKYFKGSTHKSSE
jgi:hypothetical protein